MKKIDLKCTSCGGHMELTDDKLRAICPYCHYSFLIKKEATIEELAQKEEKLSYAREKGERKAIEESEIRKKKRKILTIVFVVIIFVSIGLITSLMQYLSLEYLKDPFECVSIEFTGVDGSGKVKIVNKKTCDGFGNIKYTLSKDNKLVEGEKIKIIASSDVYRFGKNSKEYKVEGLSIYLESLEDLDNEKLNKLHNYSYNHLINNLGITFDGEVVELSPYKLFLRTNKVNKNILYDVYKIRIKTKSGNIYDKFVVAYYENFVILKNNELFSYSRLYHCGNTILAGNPNAYNAMSKDYAGFITGFETLEDFKSYLNKNNDGSFIIIEK